MSIIDTIKDAAVIVQKVDNIELYRTILQVQQDAMKLMDEKHALAEEVRALRDQVRALQGQVAFSASLARRDGMYFREDDPEPYCPHCWEVTHVAVHLARHRDNEWGGGGGGSWYCRNCGKGIR